METNETERDFAGLAGIYRDCDQGHVAGKRIRPRCMEHQMISEGEKLKSNDETPAAEAARPSTVAGERSDLSPNVQDWTQNLRMHFSRMDTDPAYREALAKRVR